MASPAIDTDVYLRLSRRCALCWHEFREGDEFKSITPRKSGVMLTITVHAACYKQLDPGDLTKVFHALERGLTVPLSEVRSLAAAGVL